MSATPEIVVFEDAGAAAVAGARRLAEVASGGGHVALAGGSTPRAAYEHAATLDVDWSHVTLWFGDERCVPPDHEHSNFGMVKRSLLDRLEGRSVPDVRRIEGERGPEEGARVYATALEEAFGDGGGLDLAMLGVGPDAHCASLFPRGAALGEHDRLAVGVETPGMAPLVSRVTMTLPMLNGAREVVFLVSGEDKAAAVRRAFASAPDPDAPSSLIRPSSGSLTVMVDEAAASELPAGARSGGR
jgi:6-phosphogluconolactonase